MVTYNLWVIPTQFNLDCTRLEHTINHFNNINRCQEVCARWITAVASGLNCAAVSLPITASGMARDLLVICSPQQISQMMTSLRLSDSYKVMSINGQVLTFSAYYNSFASGPAVPVCACSQNAIHQVIELVSLRVLRRKYHCKIILSWPGSNRRPSACEADVIATTPQDREQNLIRSTLKF
uniref:Uncharacterized protein n=1 Tax=Onchocerca volvulus TaxID=6282 RepID=A0A8R1XS06_ONCVO